MTQTELEMKLAGLGEITEEQKKHVVCSLIGHSKIQTQFWGYWYCGRCGDQVGDSLGGAYSAKGVVIVGHGCGECRANYDALPWEDKLFTSDPFAQ